MAIRTVKWFNTTKGYGFIKPDGDGQGAKISYELVTTRFGKTAAENLRLG